MAYRRKTPTDLTSLKRSRSSFTGAITKARDKLNEMKAVDISACNTRTLERLLSSVANTETGYLQTVEEAHEFINKEENADALQDEEDAALDTFNSTVADVRDSAASLISLKKISKGLQELSCDLKAVRDAFTLRPEADQASALKPLETSYASIRQEWNHGEHDEDHPLKTRMDDCGSLITQLTFEMSRTKDMTSPSPHDRSTSFYSYDGDRKHETKLPTIDVPTFNGDIMAWSTFWAAFQSAVGTRATLSDTSKLIYLRKAIKDPDTQILLNSPQETPDMYNEVVKALQARFNRTKEIHKNLVHRILQLTLVKDTRADLRKLVDTVNSTIASIKRTGTFVLETFLTSVIYLILPTKLQTLWEQHTKKQKGVAPIEELLDYLGDHAETLPSTPHSQPSVRTDTPEKKYKRQDKRQDSSSSPRQRANVHVVTPAPAYKWDCILCKTEKHPLFVCPKWQSYTVAQRLSHVQSKNLCNNCLAVGHSTSSCKSTYRCRECQQNHHTTIHQAAAPPTPVNYSSGAPSQVPDALMMTAQVSLSGPGGQQLPARALIDPGAGISLVSSRVAQLLHLPLTRTTLQFSGVQGTPCKASKHIAQLSLSPLQVDHPKVLIKAAVVSTVTNDLPTQGALSCGRTSSPSRTGLGRPIFPHSRKNRHSPGSRRLSPTHVEAAYGYWRCH